MTRRFEVTSPRSFALAGTARLSTSVVDSVIDQLVGRTGGGSNLVAATSSSRMPGDLQATASATVDGDPATSWSPGLGITAQQNSWLDYRLARPTTVDHLDLRIVSDAEHSRPTSITVTGDNGTETVPLPPIPVTSPAGSTTSVPVSFPPVTGSDLRVAFTGIDVRNTASFETSLQNALPIAVAEIGLPGVEAGPLPATIPTSCRSDLLTIDGKPVWVEVSGTSSNALAGQGLSVSACGPDRSGVHLAPGTHLLTTADGATTGINLDQLSLDSAAGTATGSAPVLDAATAGAAPPDTTTLPPTPSASAGAPTVTVTSQNATTVHAHVDHATAPFLLVLGQSVNRGWSATISGTGSLGTSTLVDGFANGWYVDRTILAKAAPDGSFDVVMRFTPQKTVNVALLISGLTLVVCLAVVVVAEVRRRRRRRAGETEALTHPGSPVLDDLGPTGTGSDR
jgi:hypothetical protein